VLREAELEETCRALKQTEAQLVRSSRLAAIGEIAAGIAHEVNNPAASILTNLELLQSDLQNLIAEVDRPEQATSSLLAAVEHFCGNAKEGLRDSLEGIQRIAFIVKGLRGFTHIDEEDIEQVDINEVVRTACNLVRHQLKHVARLDLDLRATVSLPASRGRLIQVVLNLLLNAAQAIEETSGGTIEVATASTNDGVTLRIQDDGPGIPPEIAEKVFDPFYTTKAADRGTGLGLSVCADIVHRHRGTFRLVEGTCLGGACFEAEIPLDTGLIARKPSKASLLPSSPSIRILVVDDEAALVRAYRRVLGRHHQVVPAYGGAEALAILASNQNFDLILCDLMMPGTDGKDVYEALRRAHPELLERMVFASGGPTSGRAQDFLRQPGIVLLDKPLTTEALTQFIARRFSGSASRAGRGSAATGSREGTEWK
jgi:CheY-like chemotaxis protein